MTKLVERVTRLKNRLEGCVGAIMFPCLVYLVSRVVLEGLR